MPAGRGCCVATLPLKIPTEMDVSLPQFTLHKFTLCGRWSPCLCQTGFISPWAGSLNHSFYWRGNRGWRASPRTLILLGCPRARLTNGWL